MTYTPIPAGTTDWDVPLNAALVDQDQRVTDVQAQADAQAFTINSVKNSGTMPSEHSLVAWNYDPTFAAQTSALATGSIYMARVQVAQAASTSGCLYSITTAGATLTAGQNLVGLYDQAGTQVAISADQTASWATTGAKATSWVAPASLGAGYYYLAILTNGTTGITLSRAAATPTGVLSPNSTAANARWSTGGTGLTGLTSLPAAITMANRGQGSTSYWFALS